MVSYKDSIANIINKIENLNNNINVNTEDVFCILNLLKNNIFQVNNTIFQVNTPFQVSKIWQLSDNLKYLEIIIIKLIYILINIINDFNDLKKKYDNLKKKYNNLQFISKIKLNNKKQLKNKSDHSNECCICLDKKKEYAYVNCGHMCVCKDCQIDIWANKCPICKTTSKCIKIFI